MLQDTPISGGYILLARNTLDSELMNKPPHYLKLWIWLLLRAFWKDGEKIRRGQLLTSIEEMQNVGWYRVGGRREGRYTVAQVRAAYGFLQEKGAVFVSKSTRGLIITINNYDRYQDPRSYAQYSYADCKPVNRPKRTERLALFADLTIKNNHNDRFEQHAENIPNSIRQMKKIKEVKEAYCESPLPDVQATGDHQAFISWWAFAYERTQGKAYLHGDSDHRLAGDLLALHGLKPLVIMSCWFLTLRDEWLASKRDIRMLKSQINRIPGPKSEAHDATLYRSIGILPSEGTRFEDWDFRKNAAQEVVTQ